MVLHQHIKIQKRTKTIFQGNTTMLEW